MHMSSNFKINHVLISSLCYMLCDIVKNKQIVTSIENLQNKKLLYFIVIVNVL